MATMTWTQLVDIGVLKEVEGEEEDDEHGRHDEGRAYAKQPVLGGVALSSRLSRKRLYLDLV